VHLQSNTGGHKQNFEGRSLATSGVNFINALQAAFTSSDPERAKNTIKLSIFLALSGSASVKASRRMLMKLTPGLNFINVLRTAFMRPDPKSLKRY